MPFPKKDVSNIKREYVITTMLTEAKKTKDGNPIIRKRKDGKERFVTVQVKLWFAGIKPIKMAVGKNKDTGEAIYSPVMMNHWENSTDPLLDEEGYFTKDEAKRFCKLLNTDGLKIEKVKR